MQQGAFREVPLGYLILKAVISGVIVAVVSELAKRSPAFGALVASLPLVSILALIWLWRDTGDPARVASLAFATFWFVLPSLPMFLVFPWLVRGGAGFWAALGLSAAVTVGLYLLMVAALSRLDIHL